MARTKGSPRKISLRERLGRVQNHTSGKGFVSTLRGWEKTLDGMRARPVTGAGLREELAAMRNIAHKASSAKNKVLGTMQAAAAKTREITQDPAKLLALATGLHVLMPMKQGTVGSGRRPSGRPRRKKR